MKYYNEGVKFFRRRFLEGITSWGLPVLSWVGSSLVDSVALPSDRW